MGRVIINNAVTVNRAVEVLGPDAGGHVWSTASCHPTSEGSVSYQRCWCGSWRVLLEAHRAG